MGITSLPRCKGFTSQYKQSYLKLLCQAHANGFRNFSYETHKSADLLNSDLCDIIQALKDIKSVAPSPSTLSESHALGWLEKFPMEGPVLSTLSKILASKANPGNAHDRPNLVRERNGHVESLLQQSVISSNDSLSKISRNKKALSDITYAAYVLNKEWKNLTSWFNTLRPRQNGRHFADDIFKCIFLNENARISLKISMKFVPKVRINNISALFQIMAWRRPGDKPLSEPMMVSLLTHICVTRPQWVNSDIRS